MIEIDGSEGEGGGQVLRSALTLSLLTRQPFRITAIRGRRKKPGLRAQHMAAVRAAREVGQARVDGCQPGSQELTFEPAGLYPGDYHIEIGTAGSSSLVLQTILLPLMHARDPSSVVIVGGTHVPWSPTFDYIQQVWIPAIKNLGYQAEIKLKQAGYFPKGGGRIETWVQPVGDRKAVEILERGPLTRVSGTSLSSNLPDHVAQRQRDQMVKRLDHLDLPAEIEIKRVPSPGVGSAVLVAGSDGAARFGFSALGAKGKPAERVADEALDQLLSFLNTNASVDRYLADQLLIPLALASGRSRLVIETGTTHFTTNAEIIGKFLDVDISIEETGKMGEALVSVEPRDTRSSTGRTSPGDERK